VRMPSGNWLNIRGSFAVKPGEMKRWTNGRFKSTPHRVVPPIGDHRYAPFFLGPNFDQVIECLPTCTSPDNSPLWPPVTYAQW
jgi:isopenicillin N synthase-like dioxygenase